MLRAFSMDPDLPRDDTGCVKAQAHSFTLRQREQTKSKGRLIEPALRIWKAMLADQALRRASCQMPVTVRAAKAIFTMSHRMKGSTAFLKAEPRRFPASIQPGSAAPV